MTTAASNTEKVFQGTGVSPGIARGRVQIRDERFVAPAVRDVSADGADAELEYLDRAVAATKVELTAMREQMEADVGREKAWLFEAHLMVLEDQSVLDEVRKRVQDEKQSVDRVYFEVIRRYVDSLRNLSDPYLSERAIDIEDVARRVLGHLSAQRLFDLAGASSAEEGKATEPLRRFDASPDGADDGDGVHVLVSHDLTPSDTVTMNRELVRGFVTEMGSPTSHTAILSRSLGIPAVVGVRGLLDELSNGDDLLIDGYSGQVILSPSEETLYQYDQLSIRKGALRDDLQKLADRETLTADGRRITLSANIEFLHEVAPLMKQGAEGVGLYRTEFFYVSEQENRSEEKQADIYSKVAEAVRPHEVIIRTLDVGGDKLMPELHQEPEPNPFLGFRGIRVSLAEPELFKDQLRAILRASAVGKVGVMYPFISSVGEVTRANLLLEEAKAELRAREIDYDEDIQIGAMIEIPSAAVMADSIAAEVDFLSIGTNDLVQYTMAVDRINERVADRYQPASPAVIQLMKQTIEAAHRNNIWAGVCGEMAGDLTLVPLLVGMEADELSVGGSQLLPVRRAVSRLDTGKCKDLLGQVLQCSRAAEVQDLCEKVAQDAYPELL